MDKIGLTVKKAKKLGVGASKIGGKPSVPKNFTWPVSEYSEEPLGYVFQVNMEELQKAVPTPALPKKGLLQFYCSLDESELSSPQPSHHIIFHSDPSKLVEGEFPDDIDTVEATLEERSIEFGGKGKDMRMFGEAPEFSNPDLQPAFDPARDELLLELYAYGTVTRKKQDFSIFGDGTFFLIIPKASLKKAKFEDTNFLFEGGS